MISHAFTIYWIVESSRMITKKNDLNFLFDRTSSIAILAAQFSNLTNFYFENGAKLELENSIFDVALCVKTYEWMNNCCSGQKLALTFDVIVLSALHSYLIYFNDTIYKLSNLSRNDSRHDIFVGRLQLHKHNVFHFKVE